ncbi:MAG TPA: TIM barrel protein [Candidatus Baltobacteraceae bacterium]|jgi:inosose dehydratase|nr:TIM barrel protein [Candidatus Baltobacteraceae bacterium]
MDQKGLGVVNGIRVGTASVNWGFDPFYDWVSTPSFGRMLDEMAECGYYGTEISYNFPDDPEILRSELARRNLAPAATFHAIDVRDAVNHEDAIASSMRVADRLQAIGSDVLILSDKPSAARIAVAGRARKDHALDERSWKAMCTGLQRVAQRLRARGMRAVFHPHVGTYVETRDEIDRLCAGTEPGLLGLCPDTGHLAYAGTSPEALFSDYADRIEYVHLKDVDERKLARVRAEGINFVDAVRMGMFVELGTGMVSIPNIVGALNASNYSGWIIVEQDAPADPHGSAARNRRYLLENFGL